MTKLIYMEDFNVLECDAQVIKLEQHDGNDVVVLDESCFYPKGGGQDFDTGSIKGENAEFRVDAVFFVDGEVKHIGEFVRGRLADNSKVHCVVNAERRALNTRLHSGGHTIDMAIRGLGWRWSPGKGAHYPHMAFVEYSGEFDADKKAQYIKELQVQIDKLIIKGTKNRIEFMTPEEMVAQGAIVPENLPLGKPSRAVIYDDFVVPCGGTHVANITEVGKLRVTNIKRKDGNIRVSYAID